MSVSESGDEVVFDITGLKRTSSSDPEDAQDVRPAPQVAFTEAINDNAMSGDFLRPGAHDLAQTFEPGSIGRDTLEEHQEKMAELFHVLGVHLDGIRTLSDSPHIEEQEALWRTWGLLWHDGICSRDINARYRQCALYVHPDKNVGERDEVREWCSVAQAMLTQARDSALYFIDLLHKGRIWAPKLDPSVLRGMQEVPFEVQMRFMENCKLQVLIANTTMTKHEALKAPAGSPQRCLDPNSAASWLEKISNMLYKKGLYHLILDLFPDGFPKDKDGLVDGEVRVGIVMQRTSVAWATWLADELKKWRTWKFTDYGLPHLNLYIMYMADAYPADWAAVSTYHYSVLTQRMDLRTVREGEIWLYPNAQCVIQAGKSQLSVMKKLGICHLSTHTLQEVECYKRKLEWRRLTMQPSEMKSHRCTLTIPRLTPRRLSRWWRTFLNAPMSGCRKMLRIRTPTRLTSAKRFDRLATHPKIDVECRSSWFLGSSLSRRCGGGISFSGEWMLVRLLH